MERLELDELWARNASAVESMAKRLGHDWEDAIGEIYIEARRRWHHYDPSRGSFQTFIGFCVKAVRSKAPRRPSWLELLSDVPSRSIPAYDPDISMDAATALSRLEPQEQNVVALKAMGYSHGEIGSLTGMGESEVANIARRARSRTSKRFIGV